MHDLPLSPAERASLLGEVLPTAELMPAEAAPAAKSTARGQRPQPDASWRYARRLFEALERPFADTLGQLTRTQVVVRTSRCEPATFEHLLLDAPPPTCFAVLHSRRWDGRAALEIELHALRAVIDRWLGGTGDESSSRRQPPTEVELRLAKRLLHLLLRAWVSAWPSLGPVDWELEQLTAHPSRVRAWTNETSFLTAAFELVLGDVTGFIRIAIPSELLMPLLNAHATRGDGSAAMRANSPDAHRVGAAEVVVSLRPTTIGADDLMALRAGDILTTDHAIDQPLQAAIAGEGPLRVRLGTLNGHLSVRLSP